jgi:ribosomal protein S18 acetylase RimI-like enzyme
MKIYEPESQARLQGALRLLVATPETTPSQIDQQIEALFRYSKEYGLSLERCLVAQEGDRDLTACLCIDSPGRTATVFLPAVVDAPEVRSVAVELLRETVRRSEARGVQILQGMLQPSGVDEASIFEQAGFCRLTQLLYLEHDLSVPAPVRAPREVEWVSYSPETHAEFAETVKDTYEKSLDCAALNGVRDIEDILKGHRAAGKFDADLWQLARVGGEAIGVLLMTQVPERWSAEIVYMGLRPQARGQGYGHVLLRRALEIARDEAVVSLAVCVDVQNAPAADLYTRFGFREVSRRDAWLRILSRAGAAGKPSAEAF